MPVATFVRPAEETGTGAPRVERLYSYLVPHPRGPVLFDTGIAAGDPEADARYRPVRFSLQEALARAGVRPADVAVVVNCHLHLDHIGGNALFPGTPILCQAVEYETAAAGGYTVDEQLEFPGARYRSIEGEAEVLPGIRIVPTPGHTTGHQSLLVACHDGLVVLAGQTHDTTSGWSADVAALQAAALGSPAVPAVPDWLPGMLDLDPQEVRFAHDAAVWVP